MADNPFTANTGTPLTGRVTCEGELKLNTPAQEADYVSTSASFLEFYSRSIASQILYDQTSDTVIDPLFSELALEEPLKSHLSPLPLMQVIE